MVVGRGQVLWAAADTVPRRPERHGWGEGERVRGRAQLAEGGGRLIVEGMRRE